MHLDSACVRVGFGLLAKRGRKLHRGPVKQVNLSEKVGDPVPRLRVDAAQALMLQILDGLHPPLELHPPLNRVPKRLDPTVGQGTVLRQEVLKFRRVGQRPIGRVQRRRFALNFTLLPPPKSIQRER